MNDDPRPFGSMDPNSQHQRWSRWIFGIEADKRKMPSAQDVVENARRYFAKAFKSTAGRVRCDQQGTYYCITIEIEGPPAHDASYVAALRHDFERRFMTQGFGHAARLVRCTVGLLAGDHEDGTPPSQMIVMPSLRIN